MSHPLNLRRISVHTSGAHADLPLPHGLLVGGVYIAAGLLGARRRRHGAAAGAPAARCGAGR